MNFRSLHGIGVAEPPGVGVPVGSDVAVAACVAVGGGVKAAIVWVTSAMTVWTAAVCMAPISTGVGVGSVETPAHEVRRESASSVNAKIFVFIAHLFF